MPPNALPAYALPLFGTFSVASVLGLIVLLLKFREDASKALVDLVMKSDKFLALVETLQTKKEAEATAKATKDSYVPKETYREHYTRLKHMEASCVNCKPLQETKAIRREEL